MVLIVTQMISAFKRRLGINHLLRTQIVEKSNIFYTLIRTRRYAYQGVRNVSFSENFAFVLNDLLLLERCVLFAERSVAISFYHEI